MPPHPDSSTPSWEDNYEIERDGFLTYDKQSGSRWLNDRILKMFISLEITQAIQKERARISSSAYMVTDLKVDGDTLWCGLQAKDTKVEGIMLVPMSVLSPQNEVKEALERVDKQMGRDIKRLGN